MDLQEPLTDIDGATVAEAAMPVGAVLSFTLAAISVPFQGRLAGIVVLVFLALIVMAVGRVAGRVSGAVTACMAAFAFDFFHVAPIRVLHLETLSRLLVMLVAVALLVDGSRRTRTPT